jgi:hypothetical protein
MMVIEEKTMRDVRIGGRRGLRCGGNGVIMH